MVSPTVSLIVKQMMGHHAAIKNEILHGKISLRSEKSKYQLYVMKPYVIKRGKMSILTK